MSFTREDLERLKENGPEWELPSYERLAALLARLEAVEEALSDHASFECCCVKCDAWRKACGKDQ